MCVRADVILILILPKKEGVVELGMVSEEERARDMSSGVYSTNRGAYLTR